MTRQIAVRLPDDIVEFIDEMVRSGRARSRAEVLARAMARERRRAGAERDAKILAHEDTDDGLEGLADYASTIRLDID